MPASLKKRLKQMLPPGLLKQLQKANYRFYLACHPAARAEGKEMQRLREEFVRRNKDAASGEIILRPDVRFMAHPSSGETFSSFSWTPRGVHEMDAFLADTVDRRCLLDIGAFHGIFSLAFCASGKKTAYAFEPSLQPFEVLQHNAAVNPSFGITPHRLAIGEAPGELQMSYEWQHLVAAPPTTGTTPQESVSVPISTMDAFCAEHGIEPDTVKIDVEGFELHVLRGGRDVLARAKPLLFIEIHPNPIINYGGSVNAIWDVLHSIGYEVLDIERKPLNHAPPTSETFNIVCRPAKSREGR